MQALESNTITKVVIWLAAEIVLNFVGLDNLADYSEFIFEKQHQTLALVSSTSTVVIQ